MAVTDETLKTAGIAPSPFERGLPGLENRQARNLQRSEELGQQQVELAKKTEDLTKQKIEATAAPRQAIADKIKQAPDVTVKEDPAPEYKRPTMDPKDMNEAFGMLMAASMLTGAVSRTPYNNVMTAMTGAMNGFVKRDDELVKQSLSEFDKNLASIKEKNAQKRREVDSAWQKHQNDVGGLKMELELIAGKYDDPLTLTSVRSKSLSEAQKQLDNNIKAVDNAIVKLEGIKEKAAEAHARQAAAGEAKNISKETVDFYAQQSLAGDNAWQVGLARGKAGQALIQAVKDRIPQMASEMGLSPQDVGTNKATYTALTKTLADRTKYVTAVEQLNGNLERQADLVEKLMKKGAAGSGSPVLNKWIQAGRQATGDPDVDALNTAITGLAREHQRVLTSPMSNAQLHVAAQQTADSLINLNKTPAQMVATIGVMRQEASNALKQGKETVEDVRKQMRGIVPARRATDAPAADNVLSKTEQDELDALRAKHGRK